MKKTIIYIIILVVAAGGAFYGGIKYDQNQRASALASRFGGAGNNRAGRGAGGNFLSGKIISSDNGSLTIALNMPQGASGNTNSASGGSKIVFVSDSTQIMKSAAGTSKDLTAGENITVTGTPNSDGSVNAQTIQIRPADQNQAK